MPSATHRLNPRWLEAEREKIDDFRAERIKKYDVTSNFNTAIQAVIVYLAEKNVPFRLINLGAGVKKITTDVDTCAKCHGTGKC